MTSNAFASRSISLACDRRSSSNPEFHISEKTRARWVLALTRTVAPAACVSAASSAATISSARRASPGVFIGSNGTTAT